MTHDWGRFYSLTKDSPPWPLLVHAASLAPRNGCALDLGAGAGRDTRYLPDTNLRVVHSSFEDFDFATYDLISSQFALPFIPRDHFPDRC
jgi:tellurite methyltransferase